VEIKKFDSEGDEAGGGNGTLKLEGVAKLIG